MYISHFLEFTFSLSDRMCLLDFNGIVLAINPVAAEFLGKHNNDVKGSHFSSLLNPEESRLDQYLKHSMSTRNTTLGKLVILNSKQASIDCDCKLALILPVDVKDKPSLLLCWSDNELESNKFLALDTELETLRLQNHEIMDQKDQLEGYVKKRTQQLTEKTELLEQTNKELEATKRNLEIYQQNLEQLVEQKTQDLKEITQNALLAKEVAINANLAKSEFLSNISHELRTPMHAILAFSNLGQKKIASATQEKLHNYFSKIYLSGDRLLNLLNDLLDLSKLESGKVDLLLSEHDLRTSLESCVNELAGLIEKKSINLMIYAENKVIANVDHDKIRQVIINILSNAIKFSPENSNITLTITPCFLSHSAGREMASLPAIQLSVLDEGPGIPPSELNSIFDTFTQSSYTKSGAGGTGLGLSISKNIIEQHQGQIWAENIPNKGAVIIFKVPIVRPDI